MIASEKQTPASVAGEGSCVRDSERSLKFPATILLTKHADLIGIEYKQMLRSPHFDQRRIKDWLLLREQEILSHSKWQCRGRTGTGARARRSDYEYFVIIRPERNFGSPNIFPDVFAKIDPH